MPKGLQLATAYSVHGSKLKVELHTSSLTGRPTLTVNGHGYQGDQIRMAKHEIGSLYTVTLDAVPDLHTRTLTLIVPPVYVTATEPAEVRFSAIRTTTYTTIAGPPPGQVNEYEETELRGVATAVVY